MSYFFLFREYPDVDHMSPLAWKLLERGEEVHALVSPGYDAAADVHLSFLEGYDNFHLHQPWRASGRLLGWLRATLPYAFMLLRRHRVTLLAVEWGSGPRASKARTPAGALALLRRLLSSVIAAHRGDPQQLRSNFVLAGRRLGVPVACLPHGVSIKLEGMRVVGPQAERFERDGTIDWRDRNRFAVYVLDSQNHLRWHLDHAHLDPSVAQAWGSLRWAPEWSERNRLLAPPFEWPAPQDHLRVVLMAPKWRNRASPEAARELLKRLHDLEFVSLAIKGHPRKEGSIEPLKSASGIDWDRIQDVSRVDSVPLIAASDVVIDVGSSIGLEVVTQGKVLLNAAFLHELTTVFDAIDGSCVRAQSCDEAIAYLREHHAGTPHRVSEPVMAELLRRCVYADRNEPYDVLEYYADRVSALAVSA